MIGATIGSYKILREIGAGGMGKVYLGQHQVIGRLAAIKLLLPALSANEEMVGRMFNEARLAIIGRWTLSPNVSERAAVARALQSRTPVFVSDLALEELANDIDADVRAATARAMARRIHEAPVGYAQTLARLAKDHDPKVERTARRLVAALAGANSPHV